MVASALPKSSNGRTEGKRRQPALVSARQAEFARLIVAGKLQRDAYIEAYHPKTKRLQSISQRAHRVSVLPIVQREILRLRMNAERAVLLTLNDRLKRLSQIILDPEAKPGDVTTAISVYSRISGDQAPERQEHTGKDGAPLPSTVVQVIQPAPVVRPLSGRERLAEMRRARAIREAAKAPEVPAAVPAPTQAPAA